MTSPVLGPKMKGRDKLGQQPRPGRFPVKSLPSPAQGTGQGSTGRVPTREQASCPGMRGRVSSQSDLSVLNGPAGLPFCQKAPYTPHFLPLAGPHHTTSKQDGPQKGLSSLRKQNKKKYQHKVGWELQSSSGASENTAVTLTGRTHANEFQGSLPATTR